MYVYLHLSAEVESSVDDNSASSMPTEDVKYQQVSKQLQVLTMM